MEKLVHVLPEVITLRPRVITIEVVIFVFEFVWVVGWYLEWALPVPSIDSLVCVIWICVGPWLVP